MSAAASGINLKKNKKDNADKEMKEYAETAMNELLGWYGYDKMNTGDTQALNLSLFSASTSFTRTPTPQRKRSSTSVTAASSAAAVSSDGSLSSSCSEDSIGGINSNSSISPARRDGSLSPSPANVCVPAGCASCGWCHKIGPVKCFTFKMANCNKVFCSEVCFTHYRRANFKRNKTCDWCRHVRHTVNYVDLQDGDSQYQFCSDKCLNQFKLDIFCQETKEHLEMHPHHQEQLQNLEGTSLSTLITPDLWLKNCASPPRSDKSRSSTPPINVSPDESPNASLTIELRKEYATVPDEPASKKKCKRYSNEAIKKKKSKKLVNKLRPIQLHKVDETLLKSSQPHTEPTPPRIPFYPNFSSMLPPPNAAAATNNTPEYLQRPQYFQPLATPAVTPSSRPSVSAPVVGRSSLANSQIPPLLPITRPPQIINQNPQPVSQPPPPPQVLPVAAASAAQNSAPKSILPPPTVLVPYPIVLPIPIPIPIPIPLPIFLNDAKKTTDDKTRNEEEQETVELEQDKISPPQSPVNLIPTHTKSSKKKRKKMCSSEEDSTLKHLVENY